jgi:transposase-like protein
MLSAKRDARAAERFFRKAMNADHNQSPRVINVDKNAVITPRQLTHVTIDKTLPETTQLRPVKYLNNMVEQDHRFIKRLAKPPLANRRGTAVRLAVNPGMGFGSFNTARRTLRGYEAMNMIRTRTIFLESKKETFYIKSSGMTII